MEDLKIDDMQFEILNYLLKNGETRFSELLKHLTQFQGFKHYGKESLKVIFIRKIKPLKDKGYIQRKDLGHQNVHYFIPKEKQQTVKLMLEREALKRDFNEKISSLNSPEDIEFYKKKIAELQKELRRYKRLNEISEYEKLETLPAEAVLKRLEQMGFKWQELCPNFYVEDSEYEKITGHKPRSLGDDDKLINIGIGSFFDFVKPEEIEIRLIPASEFTEQIKDYFKKLSQGLDQPINIPERISQLPIYGLCDWGKYVPYESLDAWILLTLEPVKGYYIIGAYKELLQLYEEQFNEEWLSWKEKFELSDEDWEEIGPGIREIMIFDAGRADLNSEIAVEIVRYIAATKDDAFERLKKAFMKQGASLIEAEKWARKAVEEAKHARTRIQQFNEFWLKWKSECNALTKEDFAALFRLYQNVDSEKDFEEQLEGFYEWLKSHKKEQLNPTVLNYELKDKLYERWKAFMEDLKEKSERVVEI